jgi:choline dehydrogenase-like flavoprotein
MFAPNNHLTGATIMGSDPRDSALGKDCRTFDRPILFISSSATMPTVGTVNVTLTQGCLEGRPQTVSGHTVCVVREDRR